MDFSIGNPSTIRMGNTMYQFLVFFVAAYFGCNAMNDLSSGPLKMTVEKTADRPNHVDMDLENPMCFSQIISPEKPNRYMTNGKGYCEDPEVRVFLPSAPSRVVVSRSSQLNPPVRFTQNPQDGPQSGHIEKKYGTLPRALPRVTPAGFKRKRPDGLSRARISSSQLRSSAVSSPLEAETTAHRGFRLFGFPIEIEGNTERIKGSERIKDPDEIKTALILDGTNKADGNNKDKLLFKQHVDTRSPSLFENSEKLSTSPVSRHATVSVCENTCGPKVQVSGQDQKTLNSKSRKLKFQFDADLFKYPNELSTKLEIIFHLLGRSELVMTEDQFVMYHSSVFRDCNLPKPAEMFPGITFSERGRPSQIRNELAFSFLTENLASWVERYEGIIGADLLFRLERISAASGKPMRSVKKLIIGYLVFVETIGTVVPREEGTHDINLDIENSLELVESIYGIIEPNELTNHHAIQSKRSAIIEKLVSQNFTHNTGRIWVLLDIWMEVYRTKLFEEIMRSTKSSSINNFTKEFFWVVFYLSIKNFTAQLQTITP
ncbi:hypothetical protein MJO29_008619 [Puccinia striiformis f. sp. tritici]|uniref:Uncharacterized protein n=2 Tax=Puccinia striiformis TaxID=27350 RepID=A0A0L0W272_9BASI|nr:hypothetical protein MJO29_008619 [Puccinia striiformis f. sp. tritici]KAI9603065.1 hypothetical protein H4Q26_002376 [Puccinia striiformis f. sp. tritici PST-130]KNF05604.1 hypothetical protein PSTG_01413 [Puccinia striiformis f. sp. tritici PST-78]POW19096.1 hypothetical protein PSHT_05047 [Puccinia striiformis]